MIIETIGNKDQKDFFELLSDPKIIEPIPQPKFSENQMLEKFSESLNLKSVLEIERCACGIFEKENPEMIGLALFLTNDENEKELGYRFKVKYWNKGYGTSHIDMF